MTFRDKLFNDIYNLHKLLHVQVVISYSCLHGFKDRKSN
jgi:hypothetical protein